MFSIAAGDIDLMSLVLQWAHWQTCSMVNQAATHPRACVRGVTQCLERRSCAVVPFTEARTLAGAHRTGLFMDGRSRLRIEKVGLYRIGKAIGRGNFATVRAARHEIAKTKVALKVIDKSLIDEDNMIKIEREIRILKTLDHPHIVKLYEVMRSEKYLYLATEFCTGGELYDFLIEKGRTSEPEARKLFAQTTSALQYLHQNGIVHRDLKAENILLDKNGDIKIIDFGFSNVQQPGHLLRTWCGSPPYAAPELLLGKEYDGMKADIWSLGVLLYILVTGGFPFPGESVDKLKRAVLSGIVKIPYWVSVECSDLIRKMLVLNPSKRYGVNNVLQHRWLATGECYPKPHSPRKTKGSSLLSASCAQAKPKLNPTIQLFMQTHGKWTEEQIQDAVGRKDYDNPIYGTYELLCDKVGRDNLDIEIPADAYPRRGSRGSILSGKAVVDNETLTPTISAHQLAQLNLSSPSDSNSDGASSSSEMCDESPGSSNRRNRHHRQFGPAMMYEGSRNEHRRHTLCASEQILSPDVMAHLPVGSPLHQAAIHQNALAALMNQSRVNPHFQPQLPIVPTFSNAPILDYKRMLPIPNTIKIADERRASAGENLMQLGVESILNQQPNSVEDEGQGYLSKFGGKRNTVHGALPYGPSSPIARHARGPYAKAPSTERRSSWASPAVTAQQHAQLERIYKQAVHTNANNDLFSIQQLQKEFQQLGKSAGSSMSTNPINPTNAPNFGCPRISITDEHNRSTLAPGSSFDPIKMFEQKANEVVYGKPLERPATVIGFSPTCKSGTSSPEHSNGMDTVKNTQSFQSFETSLDVSVLLDEIKSILIHGQIPFEESNEVVDADHIMHRISVSLGLEIGVAKLDPTKSIVEFAILNSDPKNEHLCVELLSRLKIRDPNGRLEIT